MNPPIVQPPAVDPPTVETSTVEPPQPEPVAVVKKRASRARSAKPKKELEAVQEEVFAEVKVEEPPPPPPPPPAVVEELVEAPVKKKT